MNICEISVGFTEFKYTLAQLVELRECLRCNDWRISSGLQSFLRGPMLDHVIPWLEFAEQIKEDASFPEKHFAGTPGLGCIHHEPKFTSDEQRYDYPLTADSTVVDVGGYHGDFAATIAARYGCEILCFEPVAEFREIILARNIPRLALLSFALGNWSGDAEFRVNNDSTGAFQQEGRIEKVAMLDVAQAFAPLRTIDLLKLNIEGSEFAVLRRMIDTGTQKKCRNISVQFHRIPNSEVRMAEIREALSATHELTYSEDYVWENWRLKE